MKSKLIILLIMSLFLVNLVSATCTLTLDSVSHVEGELAEVDGICGTGNEKNQAYTINWTNSSGFVLESDTGTTPSVLNALFSEIFTIPSGYVATYGDVLNVTLTLTDLEDTSSLTVLVAGEGNLIITDIVMSSSFLVGRFGALDFKLTDSSGDAVSNAQCIIDIVDENDLPLAPAGGKIPVPSQGDGKVLYSLFFDENFVEEGKTYKWDLACTCFNTTGITSSEMGVCNEGVSGNRIGSFKHGEAQLPFTMDSWLTVNTVVDKSSYMPRQTIFICSNVTNTRTTRSTIHIFHQIRCSSETDNNNDLDRSLIITDGLDYDERGISANTTQMQCKEFVIPEIRHLEGKSSECYATTTTWIVNEDNKNIKRYPSTSAAFNITSDTINLPTNWAEIATNKFLAVINLSDSAYADWNGIGTGKIDIFLNSLKGESFDPKTTRSLPQISFSSFLEIRQIKEIIIWNATQQVSHNLKFLEDGHLEIEIPNQDISPTGWYNITIEFEDFEKRSTSALEGINESEYRQADALEGIENKTGTFHLDVDCPSSGQIGNNIACIINAYVEDSQTVQKEVDFTCHISDGISTYSSVNFNQMITRNALSMSRTFAIPSTFSDGTQYVLQCHADYYNLGSRRDSFYDTFTASITTVVEDSSGGGSSGGTTPKKERGPGITGGAIDEGEPRQSPDINEFNPFSPDRNWAFIFVEIVILIGIISFIGLLLKKRKKEHHHYHPHKNHKSDFEGMIKKVFAWIFILLVIFGLGVGIFYGYSFVKDSFSKEAGLEQTAISGVGETSQILLQGDLTKSIFLIFIAVLIIALIIIIFTTILVLIMFKLLNIRGELKFGHDSFTRRFYEDKKSAKMQQKLNQIMLKNEIKRKTTKEDYKVRKMTSKEFADFIKKKNSN